MTIFGFLLICSWFDLKFGKIPNPLTFLLFGLGLFFFLLPEAHQERLGFIFAWNNQSEFKTDWTIWFFGLFFTGLFPLVLYITAGGGAGDVKLSWALGACLDLRIALATIMLAYLMAGIYAYLWLFYQFTSKLIFKYTKRNNTTVCSPLLPIPLGSENGKCFQLAMAPFFVFSYGLTCFPYNVI